LTGKSGFFALIVRPHEKTICYEAWSSANDPGGNVASLRLGSKGLELAAIFA